MRDFLSKKNIFNLLLLGIMVLAIPLTVKLARQQQILFSHAADTKVEFLTKDYGGTTYTKPDGTVASCVVTKGSNQLATLCQSVKVRFTAPTGADIRYQTGSSSQGAFTSLLPQTGLVSKAYAQSCENWGGPGNDGCSYTWCNDSGGYPIYDDPNCPSGGSGSGGGDGGAGGGFTDGSGSGSSGGGDTSAPPADSGGGPPECTTDCPSGYSGSCGGHDYGGGCACETQDQTCSKNPDSGGGGDGGAGGGFTDGSGSGSSGGGSPEVNYCIDEYQAVHQYSDGRVENIFRCSDSERCENSGSDATCVSREGGSGGLQSCEGYDQAWGDGTNRHCTPGEKVGNDGQCMYDANGDGAGPETDCSKIIACPAGHELKNGECITPTSSAPSGSSTSGSTACFINGGNVDAVSANNGCTSSHPDFGSPMKCDPNNTGPYGDGCVASGAAGGAVGNVGVGTAICKRVLHLCQKTDGTGGAYWCTDVSGIPESSCSDGKQKGCWVKDTYVAGATDDKKIEGCTVTSGNFTGQAGTGGCCNSDADCKASNIYGESGDPLIDNKSTAGMKCTKTNSACSTSGDKACYPTTAKCPDASTVACGQQIKPTSGSGTCEGKGTKCTTNTCNPTTGKCERPPVECKCPAASTVLCGGTLKPSNSPCTGSCEGTGTKCSVTGQTCGTGGTCKAAASKFKCGSNKVCTADANGTYPDKATCDTACADTTTKKTCYICDSAKPSGSQRVAVSTTQLYTAAECSGLTFAKAGAKPSLDSSQSICSGTSGGGSGDGSGAATFTNYRFSEARTDLANAEIKPYNPQDGAYETITFASSTLEDKFIWVQFQNDQGRWTEPKNGKILFSGQDPVITGASCNLKLNGQSLMFRVLGSNFGTKSQLAKITANGATLETTCADTICDWTNSSVIAKMTNPQDTTQGKVYQITLTRSDGVSVSQSCSVDTTQISLGARLFCRAQTSTDQDNVKLLISQNVLGVGSSGSAGNSFQAGDKQRETVTITKDGVITPKTKLQEGTEYKVCILAPKSLRICTKKFTAIEGNNIIEKLELPLCDANGDEFCNSADAGICKAEWGPGKLGNKLCEFNRDGVTNSFEWSCLLHDFNKSNQAEP